MVRQLTYDLRSKQSGNSGVILAADRAGVEDREFNSRRLLRPFCDLFVFIGENAAASRAAKPAK